jgi:hypothetical protein
MASKKAVRLRSKRNSLTLCLPRTLRIGTVFLFFFFFLIVPFRSSVNNNMAAVFLKRGNLERAKEVCLLLSLHVCSRAHVCCWAPKSTQVLARCIALDGKNAKAHFRMAKVYTELKGRANWG